MFQKFIGQSSKKPPKKQKKKKKEQFKVETKNECLEVNEI